MGVQFISNAHQPGVLSAVPRANSATSGTADIMQENHISFLGFWAGIFHQLRVASVDSWLYR